MRPATAPELWGRKCSSCGQTYELPWLVTDFGDGNIQAEQLVADAQVHECNDELTPLVLVRA